MNYYNKVSKYDLDRANLKMREAFRQKSKRRVENARAKRDILNGNKHEERVNDVKTKISRIRDLS